MEGRLSTYTKCYPMKTESEVPQIVRQMIREVGAPFSFRNDNSKVQTGKEFTEICNMYNIGQSTTESHHPQQSPAERRIGTIKHMTNRLMDRTGCPPWL